jgi:hypothetical protein
MILITTLLTEQKKLLNLIENAMGKNVSDRGSEDTIEQFGKSLI